MQVDQFEGLKRPSISDSTHLELVLVTVQHKWTKKDLLKSKFSLHFQNFIVNMNISLTVRIFGSNFVVRGVFAFFNISLQKSAIKLYKMRGGGRGGGVNGRL